MYKRKLKKCNNKTSIVIKEHSEQKKQCISDYYKDYDLQLINLDMIQWHLKQDKESECFQKKENSSSIRKRKCYNCNIKEHYMNECRKSKRLQQVARMRRRLKQ